MADWLNINSLLNSYQNSLTNRAAGLGSQTPGFDPGRQVLLNTNVNWENPPDTLTGRSNRGGPSVLSRIFDVLSRPRYGLSEATRQAIQPGGNDFTDALGGLWQGFSGKKKTSWSNVLAEQEYNMRPNQFKKPGNQEDYKQLDPGYKGPDKLSNKSITGFGLAGDILLDPINLIGPGSIRQGINLGRKGLGLAPKINELEKAVQPGASISTATHVKPTEPLTQSLLPQNQTLPPALQRAAETPFANFAPHFDDLASEAGIENSGAVKNYFHQYYGGKSSFGDLTDKLASQGLDENQVMGLIRSSFRNSDVVKPGSGIDLPKSSLAAESIISPAARSLSETPFPEVKIPKTPVGKTNPEIRSLIKEIADQAEVPRPKFINRMNKMELSHTLKTIQNAEGKNVLSKLTQTEKLPAKPPRINVSQAMTRATKQNETAEALKLAQKYEDEVLSKPNRFPTKGRNPAVNNPAQQVNFFNNKILPAAKTLYPGRNKHGVNAVALRMLKDAEDAFEAKGLHPSFWSGVPFKLSEVIERAGGFRNIGDEHLTRIMTALGNEDASKIKNPKIRQAVEGMISEHKLKETPYVEAALGKSVNEASVAEQTMSQPKFEEFKKAIVATQKADLKTPKQIMHLSPNVPLYITPKSVDLADKTLKEVFKASTPLAQQAINKNIKTVQQYIRSDGSKFWAPVNRSVTQAIHQTIGGPSPSNLSTKIGPAAKAEEWIMSRISTAYGNKDLRPSVLIAQQTARARATKRAKVLNAIAKNYTSDEIRAAFSVSQGGLSGSTSKIDALADDFTRSLENMFDSTDLVKTGNSVAYRTGMLMKDINKQLKIMKAGFKFTNGKDVPDILGGTRDFSQGNDWLKSWQVAKVDDPLVFMSKVQAAVENVVAKNAYLDDFASRWGSRYYDGKQGFTAKISDPRLKGLFYPKELAEQMGTVLKDWDQFYDPKSPLVRFFDQATSLWKTGMTIYMPAHHIRNFIGDVYLGWMDGVNTIKPYRLASKVMWSQRNRYNDLQSVESLVSPKAISAALTRPGDNVLTTKSGLDVTAEQLYTAAFNKGLLQNANVVEDIITDVIPKVKPLGGHLSKQVRGFAEGRDHFTRLAHFIDIVQKSKSKNLEQTFEEAAKRVRKWHPDGMDLTDFERKYMRRVMPFYSWTRKSIPLIVESAVTKPGKTMVYPKFMYGMQQMSGIQSESISDPFPEDQLFPDWIKEKGIGPIAGYGMGGFPGALAGLSRSRPGFTGAPEGYTVANPSNPFIDSVAQFAGMGRFKDFRSGVGQMVNPAFRIPAEIGTGQTVLGTPVDYDPNKYATENIPLVAYLSQLGNVGIAGPTERGQQEGIPNTEGIINFLTALGLRGTGASIKQAEFEARERAKRNGG